MVLKRLCHPPEQRSDILRTTKIITRVKHRPDFCAHKDRDYFALESHMTWPSHTLGTLLFVPPVAPPRLSPGLDASTLPRR
eukprot:1738526-Prymnesium_polylepis.1